MPTLTTASVFGVSCWAGEEQLGSPLLCLPTEYVGVELELEQPDLNVAGDDIVWPGAGSPAARLVETRRDGSLRNGIELVFSRPLFGQQAISAIDLMFEVKELNNLVDSVRTSVHVHVNYSDAEFLAPLRAAAINAIMEPYIVGTAGPHREANCYAVSMRGSGFLTSPALSDTTLRCLRSQAAGNRYMGFNMAALAKYGTIEYRYFGGLERSGVLGLVNMALEQKLLALTGVNVVDLLGRCDTIWDFISKYMPHAAAFLNKNSVTEAEDKEWRDEVIVRLRDAPGIIGAFDTDADAGAENSADVDEPTYNLFTGEPHGLR